MNPKILLIGLGGIGSALMELIVPALDRCRLKANISIMDDDIVDDSNVGHQRFRPKEIGMSKVVALTKRFDNCEYVSINPIEKKLTEQSQIHGFDIVVVAVDRMSPREIVHNSDSSWLDLRCQGDGYIAIDYLTEENLVKSIPYSENATSCQIEGYEIFQNIEFGFSMCATIGAQWILQKVRMINGYNTKTPKFRMGDISNGEIRISGGL